MNTNLDDTTRAHRLDSSAATLRLLKTFKTLQPDKTWEDIIEEMVHGTLDSIEQLPLSIQATVVHPDTLEDLAERETSQKCVCGNEVENQYGTCDECQDAAYGGDAFGKW